MITFESVDQTEARYRNENKKRETKYTNGKLQKEGA
jgi:hypothetical protein